MAKKYKYDDDLAEIEEFYGDDLGEDNIIVEDPLTYGEDDQVEYVENLVFDLTDETGKTLQYEMVGRIDIEGRTYIVLHRMNDEDKNSIVALRAWDDENGQLVATEITDEDEAKEVYEQITMLLSDSNEGWEDIPGGGIQWDD